jgi:hypothetical protein
MRRRRSLTRLGRAAIAVPGLAALAMGSVLVAPAAAQTDVSCGSEITESTTLTHDIGPCPGDGLIVTASNITLDLNGHTVTGASGSPGSSEQVGIRLARVTGVTVQNGEVHQFDGGVAIGGGSGNTVRALNVHDNVNRNVRTGAPGSCNVGDGVVTLNSDGNRIVDNRVADNGPLSGISLVGDSDGNQVVRNQVLHNNIRNVDPAGNRTICGTGGDQGPMTTGREIQNIGVRIEGPGANDNRVQDNVVRDSALNGIAVHGYICNPRPDDQAAPSNDGNRIQNNRVSETGRTTHETDPQANGIGILSQGPASVVCVSSNTTIIGNNSSNNFGHGVFVGGRGSHGNHISANTVDDNGVHGIHLTGPNGDVAGTVDNQVTGNEGHGNGEFDGFDGNPNCDNNQWRGNRFGSVNQPCVSGPGGGPQ